jgi:hypothetical protein
VVVVAVVPAHDTMTRAPSRIRLIEVIMGICRQLASGT